MTEEEAKKVLEIIRWADGGCPTCASALFEDFKEAFPEHAELADKKWIEYFEGKKYD